MRILELHAPIKMVQRSKGHSATAAAAYRSASRIECDRTGEVHDYSKKSARVEETALLFPEDAPEAMLSRSSLWNAVEHREKHPRAAVARDLEISLPHEFSAEQRREAGYKIGDMLVERYGVAVDLAWHKPMPNEHGEYEGDVRNNHLHALFPNRRFQNGQWFKTKDLPLEFGRSPEKKGQAQEEVLSLRQGIADTINNIASRDGLDVYVEHLSFEKRGIDREPTQHLGNGATQKEREGEATQIGDKNREIQERNAEREKRDEQSFAAQMDAYDIFYQETYKSRRRLVERLESQYGQVQRENMHKMVEIHKKQARSTGIYGFWRNITGAARRDQDELVKLEANFENIAQRQKEAFSAFEHERMQKLEVLKKEYSPIYEPELKKEFDPVGEDIDRDELAAFLEQKEAAKQRVQDQTRGIDRS